MNIKERLKNARARVSKIRHSIPLQFFMEVVEFAEAVQEARRDGLNSDELEELGAELKRLLGEVKRLRKDKGDAV